MTGHTVYAVASGKGGVGKTTTAINIGTRLAAQGERVVVVDTDLGMANLDTFLGLDITGPTLHDVLADEASVEDALYDGPSGLDVLPSGASLAGYADSEVESLGEIVETLRETHEYVVLDIGGGVSHESILPLGLADAVALITTPDVAAVRDTVKSREIVTKLDGDVLGVIVTRAGHGHQLDADEVSEELSTDLLAIVPEDEAVGESLLATEPVVEYDSESPAAVAYSRLADAIAGTDSFPVRVDPEPTPDESGPSDATAAAVAGDEAVETTAERGELDVDDPGEAPDELLDSDRQEPSSELFQDESSAEDESESVGSSETAGDDDSADPTAGEPPTDPLAAGASEHTAGGDSSDDDDGDGELPADLGNEDAEDEDSESEVERVDIADEDLDIPNPTDESGDSMDDDSLDSDASGSESADPSEEDDSITDDDADDETETIAVEPTGEFEGDEELSADADEAESGKPADDDEGETELEDDAEEKQQTDDGEESPTDAIDDEPGDVADSVVVEDDDDGEPIDVEMAGSDSAPFQSDADDESEEDEEETDDGLLSRFFG